MDYVVGSVAALVTGNVTPNRPRLIKRALTPTKHQPSPNVTPKSEFVEDRSIFLSPSMQKKKAIVKKSPKRIFQNPDLDTSENGEGNSSITSPKADKVKKHLKDELEGDNAVNNSDSKSPKNKGKNKRGSKAPDDSVNDVSGPQSNENTPKKKKFQVISVTETNQEHSHSESTATDGNNSVNKSPKKMKQRRKSIVDTESNKENDVGVEPSSSKNTVTSHTTLIDATDKAVIEEKKSKKKNKKRKKKSKVTETKSESTENITEEMNNEEAHNNQSNTNNGTQSNDGKKKKNKKRKKSKSQSEPVPMETDQSEKQPDDEEVNENQKKKLKINPNAITDKESDSEHESDDEIESENEEINKKVFESEPQADESSDDEEDKKQETPKKKEKKEEKKERSEIDVEDEIKRTIFVGNVPFSTKCKKEIKKIFNKHGQIETIRIRTVPVKDGSVTPKLAVIKNELHPERTTVNVYIRFKEEESVEKALSENNTVMKDYHLRVTRSAETGAAHDPKCSVFVGNLPFALEDEALRKKFENCGEIDSVRIIRDKKTNAGKGFGYVNFTSKDGVELALSMTDEDLTIKNRIIRVRRVTSGINKQKQGSENKKQFNQKVQGSQSFQRGPQGPQRGGPPGQNGPKKFQKGGPPGQRGGQNFQKRGPQGGQKWNQGGPNQGSKDAEGKDGAHRRIMNKRKNQDGNSDGPPNKKQNINQPSKEKKTRKEFVGMTAEKKKKRKFDKGQKKKKALSEILTK